MHKWVSENRLNEPVLQQIFSSFNRGVLIKPVNTTNPFRRGLVPIDVEVPLIDNLHVERTFEMLCVDERSYNGLLIHAMTYVLPDLNNYHKLRKHLIDDINASRCMQLFDLPSKVQQPFGAGRRELAAAFCQYIREYFQELRGEVKA